MTDPKIGTVHERGTDAEFVTFKTAEWIDLRLKAGVGEPVRLQSNNSMCFQGVVPAGDGFKLELDEVAKLHNDINDFNRCVRPYIIGRDLTQVAEKRFIIDFFGQSESAVKKDNPWLYQWIFDRVFPHREQNKRKSYRDN